MPFFEKRKRKNDEKQSILPMLIWLVILALFGAGLAIGMVGDTTTTANQTNRIGLFVGHHDTSGQTGTLCNDGLTERSIISSVADSLVSNLTTQGYEVDTFAHFDRELNGYRADLILVLHTGECLENSPSGYRIMNENNLQTLSQCISEYETATDLQRLSQVSYMQFYPEFNTIAESTPVLLIEMGMPQADREILTTEQHRVVEGLANTLACFSPLQDNTEG